MKKCFLLAIMLAAVIGLFVLAFAERPQFDDPNYSEQVLPDTTQGMVFSYLVRRRENISFDLWVQTRGTNDSLLVTVQQTNDPSDTSSYATLTNFGGVKAALGHTARTYYPSKDSTQFVGKYLRLISRHSLDSSTVDDTSTFTIQISTWGNGIE